MHADPPVEHKAYLHRSGRTARAGNEGTVVTLMLDAQVHDVRNLTRKAGVKPTITRISGLDHPVLREIAPGERVFGEPIRTEPAATPSRPRSTQPRRSRPQGSGRPGRSGHGAQSEGAAAARGGAHRGGRGRRPRRSNESSAR